MLEEGLPYSPGPPSRRQRRRTDSQKWLPALKRTLLPTSSGVCQRNQEKHPLGTRLPQAPEKLTLFTSPGYFSCRALGSRRAPQPQRHDGQEGPGAGGLPGATPVPRRQRTEQSPKSDWRQLPLCDVTEVAQQLSFPFKVSDASVQHRCPSERAEDSAPHTEYSSHRAHLPRS